mgnify:CR=1 FL=1
MKLNPRTRSTLILILLWVLVITSILIAYKITLTMGLILAGLTGLVGLVCGSIFTVILCRKAQKKADQVRFLVESMCIAISVTLFLSMCLSIKENIMELIVIFLAFFILPTVIEATFITRRQSITDHLN